MSFSKKPSMTIQYQMFKSREYFIKCRSLHNNSAIGYTLPTFNRRNMSMQNHKGPSEQPEWKNRFQEILKLCQHEFRRTTEIGRKMLTASKTNTTLHESYEELGQLVARELEKGQLDWDHPRAKELLANIKACEKDLETIESEVRKIKISTPSGPQDISTQNPDSSSEHEQDSKDSNSE